METKRVLAPTDFSATSRLAVDEADAVAMERGAELTLLHVHPLVQAVFMDATYTEPPEQLVPALNELEERLEDVAGELQTPRDRISVKVVLGTPVQQIVAETAEHDLVVIATHGRTGISHFLMGSVAERVVRAAKCSVLIFKPKPVDSPER